MNKECEGCRATCKNFKSSYYSIYKIVECPCISCIVKVMCESICIAYHKFELIRRKHEKSISIMRQPYRRIPKEHYVSIYYLTSKDLQKYKIVIPAEMRE
jgi:hypothetical protein